jgi:hypothetical protein
MSGLQRVLGSIRYGLDAHRIRNRDFFMVRSKMDARAHIRSYECVLDRLGSNILDIRDG